MTTNKRKKVVKYRGSKTHGCGSMKKRRGAGNRGGRGNAGLGKRSCQKRPTALLRKRTFGKDGFYRHGQKEKIKSVNLDFFNENINRLLTEKKIEKKDDIYLVDLKKLGFNKLLGSGQIKFKMQVRAPFFSKKAESKIKEAGGEINPGEPKEAQE